MGDTCPDCGEHLEGDGYHTPITCPNREELPDDCFEPDCNPQYCGFKDD